MNSPQNRQEQIRKSYLQLELDEINKLSSISSFQALASEVRKAKRSAFLDGFYAVYFLLDTPVKPEYAPAETEVNDIVEETASNTSLDELIEKYIDEGKDPSIIMRTEIHSAFISGQEYAAKKIEAQKRVVLFKRWDATLDMKTRETHWLLNGTVKGMNEYFETYNGKALAPGKFGIAEEDCNCRCILFYIAYGTT